MFWNVARLGKKDQDFWKGLKGWDVVVLETWMDMGGWEGMGEDEKEVAEGTQVGSSFLQLAKKEGKRGRPKGGMLMGIRREWVAKGR